MSFPALPFAWTAAQYPAPAFMEPALSEHLVSCPLCGRTHRSIPLKFGQRALCARCGARLPQRRRPGSAGLAFTITALILAIPAVQFPLVAVRKFGAERHSHLWSGIQALWEGGMPLLAVWVALCGIVVPLALIATLLTLIMPADPAAAPRFARLLTHAAVALRHWSMPEVQILAILIAFTKIGVLVNVHPGAGLWFYAGMTLAMLFAWRRIETEEVAS